MKIQSKRAANSYIDMMSHNVYFATVTYTIQLISITPAAGEYGTDYR